VNFPAGTGRLVLRTDKSWETDVDPIETDAKGAVFEVLMERPTLTLVSRQEKGTTSRH
jgi:hypothetical protein